MSAPARTKLRRSTDVPDRYAGVDELLARLLRAAEDGDWLDALLLATGTLQITEDGLQGTARPLRRLVTHVVPRATGRLGRPLARAAQRGADLATGAALAAPRTRTAQAWTRRLAVLVDRLADLVVAPGPPPPAEAAELRTAVRRTVAAADGVRLPRDGLLRPPSCFASFDQQPEDLVELAARFSARHPDRDRPLLVVGVRTSGSYLAPPAGAALRRLGYRRVVVGTTRPGSALLPGRSATVRELQAAGAAVLVLDDPPASGGSLARVCARAEEAGFPREAVHPVFALFDQDEGNGLDGAGVPERLRGYPYVVLPGADWTVRRRLDSAALAHALAAMLPPGQRVTAVQAAEPGPLSRWAHLAVPLTALVEDDGTTRVLSLTAEAAGVGYLGRHAVRTAELLAGLVPRVHGFADGILIRDRLPGEPPASPHPSPATGPAAAPAPADLREPGQVDVRTVARYVAARQERLPAAADLSLRLAGREPAWEVAARILAPVLGRLDLVLRPPLLHPLTRALLAAERPCLVDGRTPPQRWLPDGGRGWLKTDFAEGAFGHLDQASYDAAFDLAGAAVAADGALDGLRPYWTELTGARVPDARWCLLQLVQAPLTARLTNGGDTRESRARTRRAQARAVQRFLADSCLADLPEPPAGPWCVLDLDGVLEADMLGFAASSPTGMLALRALRAHGFRTVLASGRSLSELRDRCAAYGLRGGVAEYGTVCFDAATGSSRVLIDSPAWRAADAELRRRLAADPALTVDPGFRWCVRVWTGSGRHRTGLSETEVRRLLAGPDLAGRFTTVPGAAQTDFVPVGADKATGVRALFELLGEAGAVPLLAVGDGVADVPLLRWARHGAAPGNAEQAVRRAGVPVLRGRYQAGLAQAVARLTGHPPGRCPRCRPPDVPPDTAALLAVLAVPEAGRPGAPARLLRLARAVRALDPPGTGPGRRGTEPPG